MAQRTISKRTQEALAREWELRLDGSGENCMDATTVLDERGLTITGPLEDIIAAIAFIAMEVGDRGDEGEPTDLFTGLEKPHLIGPNSNNEFEMRFPHFRVA
jgi:hypothetical protein